MSKRIFDMAPRPDPNWPFWLPQDWRTFDYSGHEGTKPQPSADQMEIARLREVLRERDARIERLERQLGLRR